MRYKLSISCNSEYIYFDFSGSFHIEQVLGLTRYLYTDPNYRELKKVMMNFNNCSVIEGGKDLMVLAMKTMAERPFDEITKICCVTTDMRLTTFLETFRMITKDQPYEFQLVETEVEAKKWLEVR